MIKALRLRLTAMFTVLISLILIGAMATAFFMAGEQYKIGEQLRQSKYISAVTEKLSAKTALSDKWLAMQEISAQAIIHVEDGAAPLHFKGSYAPLTSREELIQKAKNKHGEVLNINSNGEKAAYAKDNAQTDFNIKGAYGDEYTAKILPLKTGDDKAATLYIIFNTAHVKEDLYKILANYILITTLGVILICAISWILTGLATRPTAKAMARQNEFVASAGHELRNPIAVITASLQAAMEEDLPQSTAKAFINTAVSEAERMARLTEDLLLLASGDALAMRLEKQALQLDTLCIELYEGFHLLAAQKGHTLALHLPDAPLPTINADKARLLQLLGALVSNAVEHTRNGTAIEIIAAQSKYNVKISIKDNGEGILEEEKEKIFTRFYKADKSRSDKTHFGLGLSIAKELAQLHGAKLCLAYSGEKGTCFTLTLPT
ncbi:MAG: HAMP domain-containing sensor histidine kinase [Oscillospiraceae bacterium]